MNLRKIMPQRTRGEILREHAARPRPGVAKKTIRVPNAVPERVAQPRPPVATDAQREKLRARAFAAYGSGRVIGAGRYVRPANPAREAKIDWATACATLRTLSSALAAE